MTGFRRPLWKNLWLKCCCEVLFFMAVLLHAFSHNITQYCNKSLSCSLSIYPYMSLFDLIILKLIWYKILSFSSWVCFLLVDVQFGLYWSSLKYIHLLGAAESPNVITVFPYPITSSEWCDSGLALALPQGMWAKQQKAS